MNILNWLKDKALWIFGGIAVVLAVIFAVKYERDKIAVLKSKTIAKWKLAQATAHDKETARLEGVDEGLVAREDMVDDNVVYIDKKLQEVEKDVEGRDAKAVASRFNDLYSGGSDS